MRGIFSDNVIWWIAVGVLVEVAFAVQLKCPEQYSGLLAHPRNCDKFLQCANGMTQIMVCDPGTVFNPTMSTCDAPSNVPGCEDEPPFPVYYSPPSSVLNSSEDKKPMLPYSGQIIRLRGGSSTRDGYVEVQGSQPGWGVVCDVNDGWTFNEAHLVCRQLGFTRGAENAYQGRPRDRNVPLWVAATEVQCFGSETKPQSNEKMKKSKFQTCEFIHGTDCEVERDAVGVTCLPNRVTYCRSDDEVLHAGSCYHLVDADIRLNYEEALRYCTDRQSTLINITNQHENDFVSEWLTLDHPEVKTIMITEVASSVRNETIWISEDSAAVNFEFSKWWPGWRNDRLLPPRIGSRPSCIIMKKSFPCLDRPDQNCNSEYFFWDVEDCASSSKSHSYICKRPYDDISCVFGKGRHYSGHVNVTASGKPCLPWSDGKVTYALMASVSDPGKRSELEAHNYCRNPNPKQESRPWCFTGAYGEKEHCDIPACRNSGRKAIVPEVNQYTSGIIRPGAGYSEDLQQVTLLRCYNVTGSFSSEQKSVVELGESISFSKLEDKLRISVGASGKFGMFSASAEANYLRSLQDNDYAFSINYYHSIRSQVAVDIGGFGDDALNATGKSFYSNGKNPRFGLVCGNDYISFYEQGALLSMGLNIKLTSSSAKKKFEVKPEQKFVDIISASKSVKTASAKNNVSGSVTIQAFQIGGEPNKLSQILSKDNTGNYNALLCNLQAMDKCVDAAKRMLDYATENFPKQFSFENNKGLTALGIGFTRHDPIGRLGLNRSESLVTDQVLRCRQELSSKLKENEYYQQKLYPFFNGGYPFKLDATFIDNAKSILSKANSNVRILMKQQGGAADCFNFPEECESIKATIDSQLHNITISDLKFLENIKYTIPIELGLLYNTGTDFKSWDIIRATQRNVIMHGVEITDNVISYYVLAWYPHESDDLTEEKWYHGDWDSSKISYVGALCISEGYRVQKCKNNVAQVRNLSPFFFEAYSTILNDTINDSNTLI